MKLFTGITLVALWLIALVPVLPFIAGRDVTVTGAPVPLWLSLLVAVVAASLAVMVWREQQKDAAIDARDAHTTTEEGRGH
jgi:hypothetical protein